MTAEQLVAARRERWQRLSELCDRIDRHGPAALDPHDLGDFGRLYLQAASDLAYARAQIGHRELSDYLNRLVSRAHSRLYIRRGSGLRGLLTFFVEYPTRWRAARGELLVAALLLFAGVALAWALVAADQRVALLFVPAEVLETAALEPNAGGQIPSGAFVALSGFILTNNLTAALLAFATGVLFGLGTAVALVKNGLLIGALAGLAHHGSGATLTQFAALTLPHGGLELTALVTCGAAGLKLGGALLCGGPTPRLVALRAAGREALALFGGAVPWLVAAALIEGFVTPLALPDGAKLGFAGLTAVLLVWYLRSTLALPDEE